jgi:hypothetical protein
VDGGARALSRSSMDWMWRYVRERQRNKTLCTRGGAHSGWVERASWVGDGRGGGGVGEWGMSGMSMGVRETEWAHKEW